MSIHSFLDKDEVIDFQFSAPIKATATMFNGSKVLASKVKPALVVSIQALYKPIESDHEELPEKMILLLISLDD